MLPIKWIDTPQFMRAAKDCDAGVVVWLDFMKYGVVSTAELNNSVDLVVKALGAVPDRACCFAIAPQLCSERRSGLRDEWRLDCVRKPSSFVFVSENQLGEKCGVILGNFKHDRRIEDKFDAKAVNAEHVYLRCEPPPSAKRTPIQFPGWLCMMADCVDNAFSTCALLQDRSLLIAHTPYPQFVEKSHGI